jgi:hypothetical protein
MFFASDEFQLSDAGTAYIDDSLNACVLPDGVDSFFTIRIPAPRLWDTQHLVASASYEVGANSGASSAINLKVAARQFSNGDSTALAYGGNAQITHTGGTVNLRYITGNSADIPISGTLTRSGDIDLTITRLGTTDAFDGDIYVNSIRLLFTLGDLP